MAYPENANSSVVRVLIAVKAAANEADMYHEAISGRMSLLPN